jgi:hypothetical protein
MLLKPTYLHEKYEVQRCLGIPQISLQFLDYLLILNPPLFDLRLSPLILLIQKELKEY